MCNPLLSRPTLWCGFHKSCSFTDLLQCLMLELGVFFLFLFFFDPVVSLFWLVQSFEEFMGKNYAGLKRYSGEGADSMMVFLDHAFSLAAQGVYLIRRVSFFFLILSLSSTFLISVISFLVCMNWMSLFVCFVCFAKAWVFWSGRYACFLSLSGAWKAFHG